ncbi:MAG: FG-GAP repeat protein [Myxococcales bacterium]|nr:FG-GAP repeat protein [Myxococcales bacterium]
MRRFAGLAAATLLVSATASAGTWSIQSQPLATTLANVQPDVAIDGDLALWLWSSLHRSGTTWTLKSLSAPSLKGVGEGLALSGTRAALGASEESSLAGAVATLTWNGTSWQGESTLTLTPAIAGARFGESVGLSGDTLVVAAPEVKVGNFAQAGSVYVYVRSGGVWVQQGLLTSPAPSTSQRWGTYLDIDGDRIVVGAAPGAAHVFLRTGTSWALEATLTPPSSKSSAGFGVPVEIDSGRIAVGTGSDTWVVTFALSGSTWSPEGEITAPGVPGLMALALSGDSIAVGDASTGGVETYARKAGAWVHEQALSVPLQGQLGTRLDMDGSTLIAQHLQNSGGSNTAWIFVRAACGAGCSCTESGQCDTGDCVGGVCCVGCAPPDAGSDGQAGSGGAAGSAGTGGAAGSGGAGGAGGSGGGSGSPGGGSGGATGTGASSGVDAGSGPASGSSSSTGCGCRVGQRGGDGAWWSWLVAAVGFLALRRRAAGARARAERAMLQAGGEHGAEGAG